jgi:hypothetical protein
MRDSIVIDAPAAKAFDFISDGNNDPLWRTEVDRMDVQGERQLGTLMIEYSWDDEQQRRSRLLLRDGMEQSAGTARRHTPTRTNGSRHVRAASLNLTTCRQ